MKTKNKRQETPVAPWPWSWEFSRNVFGQPKYIGETYANDAYCILDRDGFIVSEVISNWEQCVAEKNISLMAAAPELRQALLLLIQNTCAECRRRMRISNKDGIPPCEIDGDCPKGLDDAKHVIAKSYGKEN